MSNNNSAWPRPPRYGNWLIVIAALIALVLLVIDYFLPHGTIAHSWGALLVVISTGLMFIAGLLIALNAVPRWLVILFDILIILDILGTGFCAWFLETWMVAALMIVALFGWLAHLGANSKPSGVDQQWPASSKAH